jgi:hypothetical protein
MPPFWYEMPVNPKAGAASSDLGILLDRLDGNGLFCETAAWSLHDDDGG